MTTRRTERPAVPPGNPLPGWPLEAVHSGGQTGADQAGLRAAKFLGLKTGGFITADCMTERGPNPGLVTEFGLTPLPTMSYRSRTYKNVLTTDGTVLFGNSREGGTFYTMELCVAHQKPYIANPTPTQLRAWITSNRIVTLNVAGNRESVSPGIGDRVYAHLIVSLLPF